MNHQQRLDQLLAMSNEELDRIAAECQGWVDGDKEDGAFHTNNGIVDIESYSPSTDLNQAWELADAIAWSKDQFCVYEMNLIGMREPTGTYGHEHSPARILTAFGILARELNQ